MKFLCKLFRLDPESREGIISAASGLGIAVNLLIAAVKVIIGLLASSIAIVSEGVNNAVDAMTSVLTLIGIKLAKKHPDEKHPFGYGRVEYLTGLVISVMILVTGIEMLLSSVKLIFSPEELNVSVPALVIVAATAVIKLVLGLYTMKLGKKVGSSALEAVGLEGRNDAFASVITILSAVIFLIFGLSLDAYAGILISCMIIRAGVEVLAETVSELLGRPGEKELAAALYREIRGTDGVLAAADLMLHNYGPDAWSGSVNLEMDHGMTVGEVYRVIHALQLKIMHEYRVTLVFGIYAVDNDHEEVRALRCAIGKFAKEEEHIRSFHAVYLEPGTDKIYCDIVVDYRLQDWEGLRERFTAFMKARYPDRELELTIETEYV